MRYRKKKEDSKFRIGIVWADNNNRKMAGKPMLRIRHYNKAFFDRVHVKFKKEMNDYLRFDVKILDDFTWILGNHGKKEE